MALEISIVCRALVNVGVVGAAVPTDSGLISGGSSSSQEPLNFSTSLKEPLNFSVTSENS